MLVRAAVCVLVCLSTALVARGARAQGGVSGALVGGVFDASGQPLKGVKVVARSPTQIGGAQVAYTNDEGGFRLPGLLPGTFELTASAPGMRSVVQKGVKVGIGAPTEIDLQMDVETGVEEVKIIEKSPIVSTTSAAVKEVYDEQFVDSIPTEFKYAIEGIVGLNAPGAYFQNQRTVRIRGGTTDQNAFKVEGFTVVNQKVTLNSVAALEVQTAGYGAEDADAAGGVVNMVTKSGSNRYEVDIGANYEDSRSRIFRDASDGNSLFWNAFLQPSVSGPIIKDRLWFFVSGELRDDGRIYEPDPAGIMPDPPLKREGHARTALKLTWQVSPRHKLQWFTHLGWAYTSNFQDPLNNDLDAQRWTQENDAFTGLTWEALLADNLFLRSQIGVQQNRRLEMPSRCRNDPDSCDHIPQIRQTFPRAIRYGNYDVHSLRNQQSVELINTLEWFPQSRRFGEHAFKLRSRVYPQSSDEARSTPGDRYVEYNGITPALERVYYSNDPRLEAPRYGYRIQGSGGLQTIHSLSDSFRVGRYTTITAGGALTTATASNSETDTQLTQSAFTPHLSVAWDATHDGKTVLRASFNNYVDLSAVRLARLTLGDRVYRDCRYNADTGAFDRDCRYGGGKSSRTIGLPCGPSGVDAEGRDCRERLKVPRTWEYTAGAEREIFQGIALASDVVYRRYENAYELRETNRVWNLAGTALDRSSPYRNGRAETIEDLGTPDRARRRYLGVTTALHRRDGALRASLSYTWAQLQGSVNNGESNELGDNPLKDHSYVWGYLPDDSRHTVKAAASYQLTSWFSAGVIYRFLSGRPYSRRYRNDVLNNFSDLRARVGVDPGNNLNDPRDDRAARMPDLTEINLQLRGGLKPLTGINLDLFADFVNLLSTRTPTGLEQQDGPTYNQVLARQAPFRIRFGARYRY